MFSCEVTWISCKGQERDDLSVRDERMNMRQRRRRVNRLAAWSLVSDQSCSVWHLSRSPAGGRAGRGGGRTQNEARPLTWFSHRPEAPQEEVRYWTWKVKGQIHCDLTFILRTLFSVCVHRLNLDQLLVVKMILFQVHLLIIFSVNRSTVLICEISQQPSLNCCFPSELLDKWINQFIKWSNLFRVETASGRWVELFSQTFCFCLFMFTENCKLELSVKDEAQESRSKASGTSQ